MTNKAKIAVAAALIAAFATPALAQDVRAPRHHSRYEQSYQTQDQRFIEGRNAAYGDFGAPTSGRDAMVQSLGN
jgi:hypothetical protein